MPMPPESGLSSPLKGISANSHPRWLHKLTLANSMYNQPRGWVGYSKYKPVTANTTLSHPKVKVANDNLGVKTG